MGRILLLCAAGIASAGAIVRHHTSLMIIMFCSAFLLAVSALLLWIRRPLADLLEELRRHAD